MDKRYMSIEECKAIADTVEEGYKVDSREGFMASIQGARAILADARLARDKGIHCASRMVVAEYLALLDTLNGRQKKDATGALKVNASTGEAICWPTREQWLARPALDFAMMDIIDARYNVARDMKAGF